MTSPIRILAKISKLISLKVKQNFWEKKIPRNQQHTRNILKYNSCILDYFFQGGTVPLI